jgi:Carboxypeptidase regulatory-like domain/TonB dependent receptor
MSTSLPLSILLVVAVGAAGPADAQTRVDPYRPLSVRASIGDGRVSGIVMDEAGVALGGVSILATGTTLAVARSDSRGRFDLVLPVGEYLLRAMREGFLSTYREPIQVQPNRHLERRIRLTREVDWNSAVGNLQPDALSPPDPAIDDERHGHGEMAWRLRHLKRTVLRDMATTVPFEAAGPPAFDAEPATFGRWVDSAIAHTARRAGSFLTDTDFTGHINLLTTSALPTTPGDAPGDWSRGIANVFLAAPVGQLGDWSIRGAMAAGDASSWALLGKYEARDDQPHAVRFAVSYSTQGFGPVGDLSRRVDLPQSRRAGGLAASDRWRVLPSIVVDYGVRFEHYDYLSEPSLVSPHAGVGVEIAPGTVVHASTTQQMIAPGADEFLPPSEVGPWLPPVRTFFSLIPDASVRTERVLRHAAGIEKQLGSQRGGKLAVEWFSENTNNQMATLFGLDVGGDVAPYYVATVGDVEVIGWRIGIEGRMTPTISGRVEFTEGKARWLGTDAGPMLRAVAPAIARRGRESVTHLKGRINVAVPATFTHVTFGYQLMRLDPVAAREQSLTDDGLGIELRQRLPYRPLGAGMLDVVFTLSTLFHHHEAESLYDEALTVHAPARLTAGIRVGF